MPVHSRYFDYAATAPMRKEAIEAMYPYFSMEFGNPGSLHTFGLQAKKALEEARSVIAYSIGAEPKEIVFTGSGTESNNLAILGAARRMRRLGRGSHLMVSQVDHPSVLNAARALESEGFDVTYLPVTASGQVQVEVVKNAIRKDTVLISLLHVNNVTGTVNPIEEIGKLLSTTDILFHCDAVQSYGKLHVNADQLHVDLLTINGHKIGGPKGIAALYLRKGIRLDPLLHGGGQERELRPATQNVAGIVGFAKAVELAVRERESEFKRMQVLKQRFINRILEEIPGCKLNSPIAAVSPWHLNISVDRIEGQALMLELDRLGFATSSGSACSQSDHEPSYVLLAMGKSREEALESLRITFGKQSEEESVDELADALALVCAQWRTAAMLH